MVAIHRASFNIEPLIFNFLICRELALLIANNKFQQLKQKYVAFQNAWGFCCKELIAESPVTFIADNFSTFSVGNQFWDLLPAIGFPLLADSGNWDTATNFLTCSEKLIPAIGSIAASLFPLSADWLPAISYLQRTPHWSG